MAYMDFRSFESLAGVNLPRQHGPATDLAPTQPDRLTALEWSVVALAERDNRASLARPSRLSTAMRALFRQPNPKLADERLEALRRMAVLTWHQGYAVAPRAVRAFLGAGFTPGQYELLVDSIGSAKAGRVRRGGILRDA